MALSANKRARGSPTGDTPSKPVKVARPRRGTGARKLVLHRAGEQGQETHQGQGWTPSEEATLARYLVERGFKSVWPKVRASHTFWEGASSFLVDNGHSTRTSGGCRARVIKKFAIIYKSPEEADNILVKETTSSEHATICPSHSTSASAECDHELGAKSRSKQSYLETQYHSSSSEVEDSSSINDECTVDSTRAFQPDNDFDNQINVLSVHETVDYTIPSFSIISVQLRHVRATFGTASEHLDMYFLNEKQSIPDKVPVSVTVVKKCRVEVSEFSKVVDVTKVNIEDNQVFVIGEWIVLCPPEQWSEESDVLSSTNSSPQRSDSEPENSSSHLSVPLHTVTFKVIGCNKEAQYQHVLQKVRDLLEEGCNVRVKLALEPDNPVDPQAIAFLSEIDGKFQRIGYIVKEVQGAVHNALIANDITDVRFKWVKFISDWYRCGPGYFAGVNITKQGVWPSAVVRARSTR